MSRLKTFAELSSKEILAVAIAAEEEDSRIYATFAADLRDRYPTSAKLFDEMAEEETNHRHTLLDLYSRRFGQTLPPIRREDVKGAPRRRRVWMQPHLDLDVVRKTAEAMEVEAAQFYRRATAQTTDLEVRKLLTDLAEAESVHERHAVEMEAAVPSDMRDAEARTSRRAFVLQYVQPGLVGLMDGSVSTLAPVFAAAFATHQNWQTFLVGLASSIGAGVSMGFAEALSDDGMLSGRGSPLMRGLICGLMTALGGLGHTLPFLVSDASANAFLVATSLAGLIVVVELWAIAWIRARYMETPFFRSGSPARRATSVRSPRARQGKGRGGGRGRRWDRGSSCDEICQNAGVKAMLRGKDARGQRAGGVAGLDRDFRPAQHIAAIEFLGHDMHRTARDRIARFDRARMRVEALVFGEQGRVDVDDPPAPARDEIVGQQPHIARQRDRPDPRLMQRLVERRLVRRLPDALGRQRERRDPVVARPSETGRVGLVRCDQRDGIAMRLLDERPHVRATAGEEDRDVRQPDTTPAKAGAHLPRFTQRNVALSNAGHGIWAPAFAGVV